MCNINTVLIGLPEIIRSCDVIKQRAALMLMDCKSAVESQINYIDNALREITATEKPVRLYMPKRTPPPSASFDDVQHVEVSGEEVEQVQVGTVYTVNGETVVIDKTNPTSPRAGWRIRTTNGRVYKNLTSKNKLNILKWLKANNAKHTDAIIRLKRRGANRPQGITVTTSVNY